MLLFVWFFHCYTLLYSVSEMDTCLAQEQLAPVDPVTI